MLGPVALLAGTAIIVLLFMQFRNRCSRNASDRPTKLQVVSTDPKDVYDAIEPVRPGFDWKTEPPIKIRPFKPRYHLSMCECEVVD